MEQNLANLPWLPLFERLLASIICGAVIGLEREWARKQAGMRTMILICLGSALYMTVSQLAATTAGQPFDVTRIAAQVVTGVGFIGAGAIIVARGQIHGLTTAATIWTVAAIGLIMGAGFTMFGLAVTALVLLILILIKPLERSFVRRWVDENNDVDEKSEELPEGSNPVHPPADCPEEATSWRGAKRRSNLKCTFMGCQVPIPDNEPIKRHHNGQNLFIPGTAKVQRQEWQSRIYFL